MPVQAHLPAGQFDTFIRMIKQAPLDRIKLVKLASTLALERLGAKQNGKAVAGVPDGSDTYNMRTLFDFFDKVRPGQRKAIRQIKAIDATATARVGH